MNIVEAFANHLETELGVATLGQDLFIHRVPVKKKSAHSLWWLVLNSPGQSQKNVTGEYQQSITLDVHYRDLDPKQVYDKLQDLSEEINCAGCLELEGYTISEVETVGPFTDQDLDNEERSVGLLQVTITIYKECTNVIS
jgi:hypothetical protein